ncbi:MAG: hypothetical protein WCC17_23680 [Candidatus Nitrosopolaris sp.]
MANKSSNAVGKIRTQNMHIHSTAVCHSESVMDKYIINIGAMNKATADEYHFRLTNFQNFALKDYNITLNNLISQIKDCVKDAYDVLSNYIGYLQSNCNVSAMTLKQRVVTAKNFLEYYDVDKSKEIQAKGKNTQSYKKKQRGIIKRRHSRYFECLP